MPDGGFLQACLPSVPSLLRMQAPSTKPQAATWPLTFCATTLICEACGVFSKHLIWCARLSSSCTGRVWVGGWCG